MRICITDIVQKGIVPFWKIRLERSNGEDIVSRIYSQNMPCLLAALDLKKPEDLVGISNERNHIKLKLSKDDTFHKLLVSFPVEGFYHGSEEPTRSHRVELIGVEKYGGDMVVLVLGKKKSNTLYYYYVQGTPREKLERVFRTDVLLLVHKKNEVTFFVDKNGSLFSTYTVSLPTPSALD